MRVKLRATWRMGALATAVVVAATGWAAMGGAGPARAATLPGGTWGPAQDIPGLAALNGGTATSDAVKAIDCTSPGNCTAVGSYYSAAASGYLPFASTETNGTWADAQPISGAPVASQVVSFNGLSCGAAGSCAAGVPSSIGKYGYLVTEVGGVWSVQTLPTVIGSDTVQASDFSSVSCVDAEDCTAVGYYWGFNSNNVNVGHSFTMDESNGIWQAPQLVAGLPVGGVPSSLIPSELLSVSCSGPGECTAGGYYSADPLPFLVSESGGVWGSAQAVPGFTALNAGSSGIVGQVSSVSCPEAGDCAAAGTYVITGSAPSAGAFTADEANGNWGQAKELNSPQVGITYNSAIAIGCWAAGNCVVAGTGRTSQEPYEAEAYAATEISAGAWGQAERPPGIAPSGYSDFDGLSCVPGGDCTVAVLPTAYPSLPPNQAFAVVIGANGSIGTAQPVGPVVNSGVQVAGISCPQDGYCALAGTLVGVPQVVTEATAAAVDVTASASQVSFGSEPAQTITASVSSPAGGTPTGTVAVTGPAGAACTITLAGGTGSCTLPASQNPVGSFTVTGTYSGDAAYVGAIGTAGVTVVKGSTTTGLALAKTAVSYGSETTEKLTATISHPGTVPATGQVEVKSGSSVVCAIPLANGVGSCTLAASRLVPLTYHLIAVYGGDGNYLSSTSSAETLTVAKAGTKTALTLAKTAITYGQETTEKLTASVSHTGSAAVTGTVQVKSGSSVVCAITLNHGVGSCTLTAKRLIPRTYHLVAVYPGNGDYLASTSPAKTLTVAA